MGWQRQDFSRHQHLPSRSKNESWVDIFALQSRKESCGSELWVHKPFPGLRSHHILHSQGEDVSAKGVRGFIYIEWLYLYRVGCHGLEISTDPLANVPNLCVMSHLLAFMSVQEGVRVSFDYHFIKCQMLLINFL